MNQQLTTVNQNSFPAIAEPPLFEVQEDSSNFSLADYLRVLRRHKWIIVLMILLGAIYGTWKALSETPLFRATLTLIIEPERSNLTNIQGSVVYNPYNFIDTQKEVIKSRAVAERVIDDLGIEKPVLSDQVAKPQQSKLSEIKARFIDLLVAFGVSWPGREAEKAKDAALKKMTSEERYVNARQTQIDGIRSGITVTPGRGGQIVYVAYTSANPKFAADAANAVGEAYIYLTRQSRLAKTKKAGSWLTEQLDELNRKVEISESALRDFQSREGLVDLESLKSLTASRLQMLNSEVVDAQRRYQELSKRYGLKHPRLVEAKKELGDARVQLNSASRSSVATQAKRFELAKLEKDVENNRQLYEMFLSRLNETDFSSDDSLNNSKILDFARVPASPFAPDRKKIISTWALIGLIIGVILAFVREQMDNTFKTHEQVEDRLKLPVLGVVPMLTEEAQKLHEDGSQAIATKPGEGSLSIPERFYINKLTSPFAESINHLRTSVLFSNIDQAPKVILITSSMQGEGKTTLATNLALSFSQLGKTLLIDADLRKPRVARVSGISKRNGLTEFLSGTCSLQDSLTRDIQSENLYILKSGQIPPRPLELLASGNFEKVLKQFRSVFSHIVIDTAPLLPVSDAMVLSRLADATLLAIQSDRTSISAARDSLRRLKTANTRPAGVVLTQVDFKKSYYYYDKDYYARSYYTYGEGEKDAKA